MMFFRAEKERGEDGVVKGAVVERNRSTFEVGA
jgi:hypothetical protein